MNKGKTKNTQYKTNLGSSVLTLALGLGIGQGCKEYQSPVKSLEERTTIVTGLGGSPVVSADDCSKKYARCLQLCKELPAYRLMIRSDQEIKNKKEFCEYMCTQTMKKYDLCQEDTTQLEEEK